MFPADPDLGNPYFYHPLKPPVPAPGLRARQPAREPQICLLCAVPRCLRSRLAVELLSPLVVSATWVEYEMLLLGVGFVFFFP